LFGIKNNAIAKCASVKLAFIKNTGDTYIEVWTWFNITVASLEISDRISVNAV
jgi:hypothetical protein